MRILPFFKQRKTSCYCAFCKAPRRVENKKHISWTNVVLAAIVSLALMWMIWFEINPKAFVIFGLALIVNEMFIQFKWRVSLVCPHCKFDPLLYLRSPESAAQKVRLHFEGLKDTPAFYMSNHPLQKKTKAHAKKASL